MEDANLFFLLSFRRSKVNLNDKNAWANALALDNNMIRVITNNSLYIKVLDRWSVTFGYDSSLEQLVYTVCSHSRVCTPWSVCSWGNTAFQPHQPSLPPPNPLPISWPHFLEPPLTHLTFLGSFRGCLIYESGWSPGRVNRCDYLSYSVNTGGIVNWTGSIPMFWWMAPKDGPRGRLLNRAE